MTTTRRTAARRAFTREEYLRVEEASPLRHEWVGGRIYALSGPTRRHNRILVNIGAHLSATFLPVNVPPVNEIVPIFG